MANIRTPGGLCRAQGLVLLVSLAWGCSSASGDGGALTIVSCNLGCSASGAGGEGQVSCGIADVFVNGEIRVAFSAPVDESTLSVFSFQVTEVSAGKTPGAKRFVDPDDPRIVVYRPSLTFDSSGTPVFGLSQGATYTLKVPGEVEDPGATFVRGTSGVANRHRLLCTLEASLGILDSKPGAPAVTPLVDVVTAYDPATGEPSEIDTGVPASGAENVYRYSTIELVFDDLMNPATLVNPVDGTSSSLTVALDPDGVTTGAGDQVVLNGTYTIQLDQDALTTRVIFTPALGFPSAGSDPDSPRKVVVHLGSSISDLGGNPLASLEPIAFTPEVILFPETVLSEPFDVTVQEDRRAGGADWAATVPGVLLPGRGGGSGRLGRLQIQGGQIVTFDTDSEDFAALSPEQWNPAGALDAVLVDGAYVVPPATDGLFEFASLELAPGSLLRFQGSQLARFFVRGEAEVLGVIDVSGIPGAPHDSREIFGAVSTTPGPGGVPGGAGGRMPTWVGFESVVGTIMPTDPKVLPPTPAELDGVAGAGVEDNLVAPTGTFGAGAGGIAWPQPTAAHPEYHLPVDPSDINGLQWDEYLVCSTKMKGSVGAGGAFGLDGLPGVNKSMPGGVFPHTEPPLSAPGRASDFGLGIGSDPELPQRRLSPEEGWLHGGAGGGGGGGHVVLSQTNGMSFVQCLTTGAGAAQLALYTQASSAAGGAGGGALQLQAGRRATIGGKLLAAGGSGGSKAPGIGNASSGGGGAGGAILLQAPAVSLNSSPGRLDVSGGAGGFGAGGSLGGEGGAGLVRVEQVGQPVLAEQVALVTKPSAAGLAALGAAPSDVQSTGLLTKSFVGPNGRSGAQSCWLQPDGVFFQLEFLPDGDELGWDLSVIPDPPSLGEQSFRGPNDLFAEPLEVLLGNEFGASPLVVRFQGARIVTGGIDLCELELAGADPAIQPGSLTGWVTHPAQLNATFADPALQPNAVRFQILFDETQPTAAVIAAVAHLEIRVQRD